MKTQKQQACRRSKRAHEAILAATLELIEQRGYLGLSIEGIAACAGVGKQTIYRWWPTKAALVIEAYSQKSTDYLQSPDTGSVKNDLEVLLTAIFTRISAPPSSHVITGLVAESQNNPELAAQFHRVFLKGRRELVIELIEKGITRGEVNPEIDMEIAADSLFGPMWYRLLIRHTPLDQNFAKQLVRQTLAGMSASSEEK
ncbi:MAG: TetR/AcrR family transcriptional regulator [Proteobacteria bacterium]|nr:TetR/AcrR family transcriptional regulator [Pseudomonadota bacterium]MBU1419222.1 TetR/AcrR family transcriptional regulator [Pseudomonadota bacterium]MBU1453850.1 TetR/AcrR family transcriptional regulator [Pseudomonadota bacterium]